MEKPRKGTVTETVTYTPKPEYMTKKYYRLRPPTARERAERAERLQKLFRIP